MRRVVVTGLGAITPIGLNVEEFWNGIKESKLGFAEITKFDASEYKAHLAAEVKGFVGKEQSLVCTFSQQRLSRAWW